MKGVKWMTVDGWHEMNGLEKWKPKKWFLHFPKHHLEISWFNSARPEVVRNTLTWWIFSLKNLIFFISLKRDENSCRFIDIATDLVPLPYLCPWVILSPCNGCDCIQCNFKLLWSGPLFDRNFKVLLSRPLLNNTHTWRFLICKMNCALLNCWNNTWEQNKLLISAFWHSLAE